MHLKKSPHPVIACWLALLTLCACAADFAPPAIGPVAFRRDRLPISAGTMAGLSRNLDTIARSLPGETAAQRQAAARAIALAIALEPSNEEPRKLLELYQNGGRAPEVDAARLAESQARIWQLIAWLETPEATEHGQALAFCLQDLMAAADPKHPRAAALREAGDKGAWAGWVPDIHAYEPQKIAATPQPGIEASKPETTATSTAGSEIRLPKAGVQAVLSQQTDTGIAVRTVFSLAPLQMSASRSQVNGDAPFSISIGPDGVSGLLTESTRTIRQLLEKQHGELPARMSVRIYGNELTRSLGTGKAPDISAAAAVLASAAITGREPDAVIIGLVDESGAFKLPSRFWDQLQALGSKSHRVVLPAAAAEWLPAFIVLENPGFFMNHEILLASDFRQLLELSAKSPAGAVADAEAKYQEIRARGEGQDVRTYLSNRFVRQRLEELVKEAPFHASAAMLLLQGSSNRPREIGRAALASELRRAIEPMAWISKISVFDSSIKETRGFNTMHKSCRLNVDKLERYVAKSDLELFDRARETTTALWKLNRAVNARGDLARMQPEIQKARFDFSRLYREVMEQLNQAAR